ncbi:hypothetical protein FQR65_LT05732 [Abscondita terminalis]|nr:hypothetical protein FQR65_LT05732 [Abscondita terminalis]
MNFQTITPDQWTQHESELLERLKDSNQWDSIPSLNVNDVQNLHDMRLVRFRGMIQDIFNPEYYHEQYEVIINRATNERSLRNAIYRDITYCKDKEVIDYDSEKNIIKERHTMVVITTPGLNEWVYNIEKDKNKIQTFKTVEIAPRKRSLDAEEEMETEPIERMSSDNKKQCTIKPQTNTKTVSREHLLNVPLPDPQAKACHVKLYKHFSKIKLNDIVEVIGFLSVDPALTDFSFEDDFENEMEIQTHNPPPSLIPRVHCVTFKKITHVNPLLDSAPLSIDRIPSVKKELNVVLTQLLMGDTLAAEYLMKSCFKYSNVPTADVTDFGRKLSEFVALMVPTSYYLPMSLENMNELSFIPKKDYECDRLTSGLLQLSPNTQLILDETQLAPGRLNESGVKAITALSSAIKHQKVTYDFNFYPVEMDCDIAFLILSEGKTLLSSDFQVHLKPDPDYVQTYQEIVEASKIFLKPELLNDIRVYLTQVRHSSFELNDEVHEMIQNDTYNCDNPNQ